MKSMTGFGRGTAQLDGREATVELKAVNSRYLDLLFRMPRLLNSMEERIRTRLTEALYRGKVDVSVSYANRRDDHAQVLVDVSLATSYQAAMNTLADATALPNNLSLTTLSGYPMVLTVQEAQEDEEAVWAVVSQALEQAIEGLNAMRAREGQRLYDDLTQKLGGIEAHVRAIAAFAPLMEAAAKAKLVAKMQEYTEGDEGLRQRVLVEAALLADKRAIDEELVRLSSHREEFLRTLALCEPIGRTLDFIMQEMNREINTIGSKAAEQEVNARVIAVKSEMEKVREQIQNIE